MKLFIATAATALMISGAAYADGHAMVAAELENMGIEFDASALETDDIAALEVVLNNSNSPARKKGRIMQILGHILRPAFHDARVIQRNC